MYALHGTTFASELQRKPGILGGGAYVRISMHVMPVHARLSGHRNELNIHMAELPWISDAQVGRAVWNL